MTDTVITPTPLAARHAVESGLLTPLLKAYGHIALAHAAITRRTAEEDAWAPSIDAITAELAAATVHAALLRLYDTPLDTLLTETTRNEIRRWIDDLNGATTMITGDNHWDSHRVSIEDIMTLMWQLTTRLDRELTGLNTNQSDPGRTP